jgi:hypothetical protein
MKQFINHTYENTTVIKKHNKTCFQKIAKHLHLLNLWVQFCKHVPKQLKSLFNFVLITILKKLQMEFLKKCYFQYINVHILKI